MGERMSLKNPNDTVISGVDTDGVRRQVLLTADRRLSVSLPPPTSPPDATAIDRTDYNDVTTTSDNTWTIPNGETVVIQRLSAGSEVGNGGSVVELWYDPLGTGVNMTIIDAIHCDGNASQHDLNESYLGDGTKAIRMRRKRYGGGGVEIFGRWEGYY
jgi:hypothetical protein